MILKIKKCHKDAKVPAFAHKGDAGMDLHSVEDVLIKPKQRVNIKTGIYMQIPVEHVGLFWDKSGLAAKNGITCLAGVIDSGYRGELIVTLLNTSQENYQIKKGDKITQLLIQKVNQPEIKVVESLSETDRGQGKHGSTGR